MLWSVGTISPFKVFYLDQDRWNELPGPADLGPDLRITAFAALGEGTLAIGTDKRGVLLRHGGTWARSATPIGRT